MFKTRFLSKIKHGRWYAIFLGEDERTGVIYHLSKGPKVTGRIPTEYRMDVSKRIPVNFIEGHK